MMNYPGFALIAACGRTLPAVDIVPNDEGEKADAYGLTVSALPATLKIQKIVFLILKEV